MATSNSLTVAIISAEIVKLVNKSEKRGESYSLYKVSQEGSNKFEYQVLHNRSKVLTKNHVQIFVTLVDDSKSAKYVSFIPAKETPEMVMKPSQFQNCQIIEKDMLTEISYKLNEMNANAKKNQVILFDVNSKEFSISQISRTIEPEKKEEKASEKKEEKIITVNPEAKEKKLKKNLIDFHGFVLTELEKTVLLKIYSFYTFRDDSDMNLDYNKDSILSYIITEGSLSISGAMSMLNRKGLLICGFTQVENPKTNKMRKERAIKMTDEGARVFDELTEDEQIIDIESGPFLDEETDAERRYEMANS